MEKRKKIKMMGKVCSKGHNGTTNKTKDWALVQNAALVMKIKVLKLGLVR